MATLNGEGFMRGIHFTLAGVVAFVTMNAACENQPAGTDLGSAYDPTVGAPSPGKDAGKSTFEGGIGGGVAGSHDSGSDASNGDCDANDSLCNSTVDAGAGEAGACATGQAGLLGAVPGATMAPGTACVSCHLATNAHALGIAGTVYQLDNEPDNCLGVAQNIKVVITDSLGQTHDLTVNSSGNFSDSSFPAISAPYTARVEGPGGSRPMIATITSGDCNSCHTATGASGAPGRITAP